MPWPTVPRKDCYQLISRNCSQEDKLRQQREPKGLVRLLRDACGLVAVQTRRGARVNKTLEVLTYLQDGVVVFGWCQRERAMR